MQIRLKRAYEPAGAQDGKRVLVDRIWPRGVSKRDARIDEWLRDAAPSTALRKWFAHDPGKWQEFMRRYAQELDGADEVVAHLTELVRGGRVTFVYGARDEQYNNAVALKEFLENRIGRAR
jgi:uncharacterized protein YeaO (DUF488 family)